MKSYVLNWSGTGAISEIFADTDEDAIAQAIDLTRAPIVADQWDADGWNDDGEPCKRILLWDTEELAENDAGAKATASLSTIGAA